jgi:predicted outer membrane repeat protein
VRVDGGNPSLIDCTFEKNVAGTQGGAVFVFNNGPIALRNLTFIQNTALYYDAGGAGAVYLEGGTYVIDNCRFIENKTLRLGGAVWLRDAYAVVTDCTFAGNSARYGGALGVTSESHADVSNCLFTRNRISGSERLAAALWVGNGVGNPSSATVINCTFSQNTGPTGSGALGVTQTSTATAANCVFWDNTPAGIALTESGAILVSYSDVQGGWSGTGNINADPLFADPNAGNYRLGAGSPGIDAGDNTAVPGGVWYDLDGNRRFIDSPLTADTGVGPPSVVDMGCYEYQGKFKAGDLNCDGAINFGDVNAFVLILGDLNAWQALYPDCPRDNGDVNYDRNIDFGDVNPFVELLSGRD